MATIDELYEDVDAKDGSRRVIVQDYRIEWTYEVGWRFELGRVPTAHFRVLNPPHPFITYNADVKIEAGFNGVMRRVFTGIVLDVATDEQGTIVHCVGKSWPLDVPWQDLVVTLNNIDATAAIENLLDLAQIRDYVVDMPAWQIGTVVAQTLQFSTFGEAIMKIAEVDGGMWYETPTGQVVVRVVTPVPSTNTVREYFSMILTGLVESYPPGIVSGRPRLRNVLSQQDVRRTRNEIFVKGATITTTGAGGEEESADLESTCWAPSPYVVFPDGSQAYNDLMFANELIDTQVKADEVCHRLMTVHNRLWAVLRLSIAGDPRMQLAETHRIEDPAYTRTRGRWFVQSYQSDFTSGDFITTLNLIGGGGLANQNPIADFSWVTEEEVIDDRKYVIVSVDARLSHDPDGTIAGYSWTDNQGPIIVGVDPVITVRADPAAIAPPWEVTLTVTDNDGATASVTKVIAYECGELGVFSPAFYAALDNAFAATYDSGQSWNDQAGVGVISVVAPWMDGLLGLGVYGTSAGAIYRTTDYCLTAPGVVMAAVGSPIRHMWWDQFDPDRVWAVTQDARVYRSLDQGATWALYIDLRLVATTMMPQADYVANRIDTVNYAGRQILRVYGGNGAGLPMIAFHPMVFSPDLWGLAPLGGELLADLSSPPADLQVYDAAYTDTHELAIILDSATHLPAVYYTTEWLTDPTAWTRALGAPGKSRGRWIEPDLEPTKFMLGFNDNALYTGDVAAGVMTVAAAAATLTAGQEANHGLWLGRKINGLAFTYIIPSENGTGELGKTWNRGANAGLLRPAIGFPAMPANSQGRMIDIGPGPCAPPVPPGEQLYVLQGAQMGTIPPATKTYARRVARLGALWEIQSDPAPAAQRGMAYLKRLGDNLYRQDAISQGAPNSLHPGQLERSADDGVTWANVGPTPVIAAGCADQGIWGVNNVTIGPDGVLWLVCCGDGVGMSAHPATAGDPGVCEVADFAFPEPRIYKSTDDGVTWVQVHQDFDITTLYGCCWYRRMMDIAVHPNDPMVIVAYGDHFPGHDAVWVSTDGGASWSYNAVNFIQSVAGTRQCVMMDNGRLVVMIDTGGDLGYTDDYGLNWTNVGVTLSAWQMEFVRADQILFGIGTARVMRSFDYGENWEEVVTNSIIGGALTFLGAVYSRLRDTLYIACSVPGQDKWQVMAQREATQPTVGDVEDLTFNLASLFTDPQLVDRTISHQGISF